MFSDFLSLIFPDTCLACDSALLKGEEHICTECRYNLPKTNFHLEKENILSRRFWGKVQVNQALAYLRFEKRNSVQKILYKIKYEGKKEAAELLGSWYGHDLAELKNNFDLILPVPMHHKKQKRRGFNQSEFFAKGLSESLGIEMKTEVIERKMESSTQTNKGRLERWENVKEIYSVKNPELILGKRILLVDDVITTGATLEVCSRIILEAGAKEVNVVALASAQ